MTKTQKRPTKAHKSTETRPDTVRKYVPILGVKIDSSQRGELLKKAQFWIASGSSEVAGKGYFIVTPNPEIITRASSDSKLMSSLNGSDMALPDGIGVVAAMKYLSLVGQNKKVGLVEGLIKGAVVGLAIIFNSNWLTSESEVIPGRVFMEKLIEGCAVPRIDAPLRRGRSPREKASPVRGVFLLGATKGVAEAAGIALTKKYGNAEIKTSSGPWLNNEGIPETDKDKETENAVISEINKYKPHLLFVAFGPPKQEKWLARNLPKLKVGIAMTVGGSLDYIAGIVPEPPRFVSDAGFEWLWRLITQPWRVGRIFTAVVVFPLKVFLQSIR